MMTNNFKIGDMVLTDCFYIGFVVEIDKDSLYPKELIKVFIGNNISVWDFPNDLILLRRK